MTALDLTGNLVRLAAVDPDPFCAAWARWMEDSEYDQFLDTGPTALFHTRDLHKYLEKEVGNDYIMFGIHTLQDSRLVGFIDLGGFDRLAHSAWVAIGIGEEDCRGRGLGSDAMRILTRYAFTELNLHRINLTVFEYNARAIRSYEKCGFVFEGCQRQLLLRDGRRWAMIFMGLLKEDWLAAQT